MRVVAFDPNHFATWGWSSVPDEPAFAHRVDECLEAARAVFGCADDFKIRYARPELDWHVGWRGASRADRPTEVWQLRADGDAEGWPPEFGRFCPSLEAMVQSCVALTSAALESVRHVSSRTDAIVESLSPERSVIRLLHYAGGGTTEFSPHTDMGVTTIFAGETVPALEMERGAEWVRPGGTILAAGDLLEAAIDGVIPAAAHRTVPTASRLAIAVFVHTQPDFVVSMHGDEPVDAATLFARRVAAYVEGNTQ